MINFCGFQNKAFEKQLIKMEKQLVFKKHSELVKYALLNAQQKYPRGRFFKRDVGVFKTFRNTMIKIGIKGQSDIYGFIPCGNTTVWVEIECKLPRDKLSKYQKSWKNIVEDTNGVFVEFRNLEDFKLIDEKIKKIKKRNFKS